MREATNPNGEECDSKDEVRSKAANKSAPRCR